MKIIRNIVAALLFFVLPVTAQTVDLIVSGDNLRSLHHADLLQALRLWVPDVYGDMLVVVDGARIPTDALTLLTVYDIELIRVVRDPQRMVRYGSRYKTVVEVSTRRVGNRSVMASYHLDADLQQGIGDRGSLPSQTGYRQRHQLDVEGRDKSVGYLLSAMLEPKGRGVLCGMNDDALRLRAAVSYTTRGLRLRNDLSFVRAEVERSQVVRYTQENSSGSFAKQNQARLVDRFGVELDLARDLLLQGDFSFGYYRMADDIFLSPYSTWFADDADIRQRGSFHKSRDEQLTYEGGFSVGYQHTDSVNHINLAVGARLYSGSDELERYGGLGVLSDRMAYVSFTLGYDTLGDRTATRYPERTLTGWGSLTYEYKGHLGFSADAALWRSSLLAPHHRTDFHWSVGGYWHLHRERWMRSRGLQQFTLGLMHGNTSYVPFGYESFTTLYRNRTDEQYIHNYYQMGSGMVNLGNEDLRPLRTATTQAYAQVVWHRLSGLLRFYHKRNSHLPQQVEAPVESGFFTQLSSVGHKTVQGMELTFRTPLVRGARFGLDVAGGMLSESGLTAAHASLLATSGHWQATFAISGDEDFGQSAVRVDYRFPRLPAWLHDLRLGLSVTNPIAWQPDGFVRSRAYGLSFSFGL